MALKKPVPVQTSSSYRQSRKIARQEDEEKPEELLVFGYAAKLFRDDEKARYLDRGKHLIPWMGDTGVMIDRSVEISRRQTFYLRIFSDR